MTTLTEASAAKRPKQCGCYKDRSSEGVGGPRRREDPRGCGALRLVLADLPRAGWVRSAELGRLHRSDVAEQLSGLPGEEPDPELVDVVYRRSLGNPAVTGWDNSVLSRALRPR
jgi:hypothetical protein